MDGTTATQRRRRWTARRQRNGDGDGVMRRVNGKWRRDARRQWQRDGDENDNNQLATGAMDGTTATQRRQRWTARWQRNGDGMESCGVTQILKGQN